jgi:methionyl-tRNA synthetase
MLLAAGVKLPDTIFLHGFFTVDVKKMSTTLGNFIDPNDMVAEFGPDAARYLLLTQYPFGVDGDIKARQFVTQYNSDLANDLGNLVSRVTKMIAVNFDGVLPELNREIEGLQQLMEQAEALPGAAYGYVTHFELGRAISEAMNLVRATNKFFNDRAPWVLAREGKKAELGGVLYACCEVIRIVSIILYPIMPGKMREIRSVLGLDDSTLTLDHARIFFDLKPGTKVTLKDAIFPRLKAQPPPAAPAPAQGSGERAEGTLDMSEFSRADMHVAEVVEAERVKGTDKLLKLQISLGDEKRQIVAGIAEHYSPEKITGMKIIVVTNLKPVVIRGIPSNGMLLAATSGKKLVLLTPDGDLPAGAKVS